MTIVAILVIPNLAGYSGYDVTSTSLLVKLTMLTARLLMGNYVQHLIHTLKANTLILEACMISDIYVLLVVRTVGPHW